MSSSTSAPKLPFQSLTSANPLCSLPNGGMFGHQEAIREQAEYIEMLISSSGPHNSLDDSKSEHNANVFLKSPLFSENYVILANKGYKLELLYAPSGCFLRITWKCPGGTCAVCNQARDIEESAADALKWRSAISTGITGEEGPNYMRLYLTASPYSGSLSGSAPQPDSSSAAASPPSAASAPDSKQ